MGEHCICSFNALCSAEARTGELQAPEQIVQGTLAAKEKYFLLPCLALSKREAQELWAKHRLTGVRSVIGLGTEGEPPHLQSPRSNCYSGMKALGRCPIQGRETSPLPEPPFWKAGKRGVLTGRVVLDAIEVLGARSLHQGSGRALGPASPDLVQGRVAVGVET